jgi:Flp pilus assembly protein TadG
MQSVNIRLLRQTGKRTPARRRERGVAAVELALISILMLTLLLGAFDFGRLMYWGVSLTQAAAAGAQFGSRSLADAGKTQEIRDAAAADWGGLGGTNSLVVSTEVGCTCSSTEMPGTWRLPSASCSLTTCTGGAREYLKVTATTTFNTLVPFPGIPSTVNLSRTAVFRVQ